MPVKKSQKDTGLSWKHLPLSQGNILHKRTSFCHLGYKVPQKIPVKMKEKKYKEKILLTLTSQEVYPELVEVTGLRKPSPHLWGGVKTVY